MKTFIITLFTFALLNLYAQPAQAQDCTIVGQHTIICVEQQASALETAGYTITVVSRNSGLKTQLEEKMQLLSAELARISSDIQDNLLHEISQRMAALAAQKSGFLFMGEYYEDAVEPTDMVPAVPVAAPAPDLRVPEAAIPVDDMLIPDHMLRQGQFLFMNEVYDAVPAEEDLTIPGF